MSAEFAELKSRCERLNALYQVSNVIHSTLDPQEALRLILREAIRLTRASSGSVILINPNTRLLEIHASHGLPENTTRLQLRMNEGITGWVARSGRPARVGNVKMDARYIELRAEANSELAVPLELNDEIRGVLNVDADRSDAFSEEDEKLLQELAIQAAKVIQNTWLYEQLRLKARLFETLASVGQTINSALGVNDALKVVTREACVLMSAKMCSLTLLDETKQWLDVRASHGASGRYLNKPRLGVEESLLGVVVRRKKPLQVENVQTSGRYQNVEVARSDGLVSLLSVPLMFADQALGTLNVYTKQPYVFSDEEIRILSAFAGLSAIAIEKARLYERIVDVEEQMRQNEKLSALGLLAAEVAHEIRNPLTVMKMLYHSLDLKFGPEDPRAKDAEVIGRKMEQLNVIVERILDFTRVAEPQYAPVDVNRLADELALLTRHKLAQQNIRLESDLTPDLPALMADATQLEQAFLNLILNAADAMPDGGQLRLSTRVIQSETASAPKKIIVEFKDTGAGMDKHQQMRIFGSLLRTTKRKGTGLGLAIVKRIVENHQGELKIVSRAGKGTTVSVELPLWPCPEKAAAVG